MKKIYENFEKVAATELNPKWNNMIMREKPIYKKSSDMRSEFERDYTRIIYCNAYKRLKHKTQVFFSPTNDHICTRIEHVSHVESISYIIAKTLKLNVDLTRVISVAHDLGHSPFGHNGEHVLNKIAKDEIGENFWHERNGLIVVDTIELLENEEDYKQNLDLTYAVRDGIISHCGEVDENGIKPREEYINLYDYKSVNQYQPYTWEGCVVKIADKISYVGRDIEDAIRFNILNKEDLEEFRNILKIDKNEKIILNNTNIINKLICNLLENSSIEKGLNFSIEGLELLNNLKKFNYKTIYGSQRVKYGNAYFELIIRTIYDVLKSIYNPDKKMIEFDKQNELYPEVVSEFINWLNNYSKQKILDDEKKLDNKKIYNLEKKEDYYMAIIEYIAGMTDNKAISTFEKIINF